ncbi:MAG: hypothetical protein JXQ90_05430 [Cyclobacteriaceae bacterium]
MLTLIRPLESKEADVVESRLKKLMTAYEVLNKNISNDPYLLSSGLVFKGAEIETFLDALILEKDTYDQSSTDSREIG